MKVTVKREEKVSDKKRQLKAQSKQNNIMLKIQKDQDKENIRPASIAIKLEENERKTRSGKESVKGSTFKITGLSTTTTATEDVKMSRDQRVLRKHITNR